MNENAIQIEPMVTYVHPEGIYENINPELTVYHYTSRSTLIKIIENRELWASHIKYLNDMLEFSFARRMLRSKIETKLQEGNIPEKEAMILSLLNTYIDEGGGSNIYVTCFSEEGDQLSQWRGYTPDGSGYAVGIKIADLQTYAHNQGFILRRCTYEDIDQQNKITSLLDFVIGRGLQYTAMDDRSIAIVASIAFSHWFDDLAPVIKHPSFREEKEIRLILKDIRPNSTKVRFRAGTSTIVPYIPFEFSDNGQPLKLSEVVIGPTPDPDLARKSVQMLLDKYRIQANIRLSEIPFRNW